MQKTASAFTRKMREEHGGREMTVAVVPYTDAREGIAEACRRWAGNCKSAAKTIARAIDCSPRTAENLLAARNAPNAEGLIALMRESDEVFHTVLVLANRMPDAERLRRVQQLDAMLRTIDREAAE